MPNVVKFKVPKALLPVQVSYGGDLVEYSDSDGIVSVAPEHAERFARAIPEAVPHGSLPADPSAPARGGSV